MPDTTTSPEARSVIEKLQRVLQTMTNDEKSEPQSLDHERFAERSRLLLECIEELGAQPPAHLPEAWGIVANDGTLTDFTGSVEAALQWALAGFDVTPFYRDPPPQSLNDLIEQSKLKLAATPAEEREAMWQAQRESFVRGMTTPCEHGVLDFEQCPRCRESFLTLGNPTPPIATFRPKYLNKANGKTYELLSEDDGIVSFRPAGGGAPAFLGKAEFDKRFQPASDTPPPQSHVVAVNVLTALRSADLGDLLRASDEVTLPVIERALAATAAPGGAGSTNLTPSQALLDVAAERRRQVEVEGWSSTHDDQYRNDELTRAAMCYLLGNPGSWPWEYRWWKPADRRRNLIKAAALIIAEIERLDRAAAKEGSDNG